MENLEVYSAVAKITGELSKQGISKDRKNQQQGYAFRGIDDIYKALSKLLAENNLCIFPFCEDRNTVERATQKGGVIFYTTVKMRYKLISAVDGSCVECCTVGEAMDSADKSTNKAMSAAYKYLCLQIFCIPTEGDNDADATTPPLVKPMEQPKVLTLDERINNFKDFIKTATLEQINKSSAKFTELKDKADKETAEELLKLWNDRCQFLMQEPIEEK